MPMSTRPLPFAFFPVAAGITALDHLIAPAVAHHDKGGEITTTKANDSERRHDKLVSRLEEEPQVNPSTGTMEFSLRDPDGYYVTISALNLESAAECPLSGAKRTSNGQPPMSAYDPKRTLSGQRG
jgi:hypothetical protein